MRRAIIDKTGQDNSATRTMVNSAGVRLSSRAVLTDSPDLDQTEFETVLRRWLKLGWWTALLSAATLLLVHYANFFLLDRPRMILDANGEVTVWSWASMLATGTVAAYALLGVCVQPRRWQLFSLLAVLCAYFSLDDQIALHERIASLAYRVLRLPESWDSVIWPVLYLPLLAAAFIALFRLSGTGPVRIKTTIRSGLFALVAAVVAEVASAPWSTDNNVVHILEGGVEEALELAGWLLVATGTLAAALTQVGGGRSATRSGFLGRFNV
jgi:hypothetical protein